MPRRTGCGWNGNSEVARNASASLILGTLERGSFMVHGRRRGEEDKKSRVVVRVVSVSPIPCWEGESGKSGISGCRWFLVWCLVSNGIVCRLHAIVPMAHTTIELKWAYPSLLYPSESSRDQE
jgi:hypothetical protein